MKCMSLFHKPRWLLLELQEPPQRKKAVGRLGKEILPESTVLSVETIARTLPSPMHVSMEVHCSPLGQHARSLLHRREALDTAQILVCTPLLHQPVVPTPGLARAGLLLESLGIGQGSPLQEQ